MGSSLGAKSSMQVPQTHAVKKTQLAELKSRSIEKINDEVNYLMIVSSNREEQRGSARN